MSERPGILHTSEGKRPVTIVDWGERDFPGRGIPNHDRVQLEYPPADGVKPPESRGLEPPSET